MERYRFPVLLVAAGLAAWLATPFARAELPRDRAGCPSHVACYAVRSDGPSYVGYYVGGGSAVCGSHRYADEGTWGWDYGGCLLPHRVILSWSHRRYQGGTGAYRTEGPPVPDVPACTAAVVKKPFQKCDNGN